jgi:hypothetical protein
MFNNDEYFAYFEHIFERLIKMRPLMSSGRRKSARMPVFTPGPLLPLQLIWHL